MAYRIEGKDIVIDGFEQGIAESPYLGIADMRNANIVSVPGEASVNFKTAAMSTPPTVTTIAFTATAATDLITVASTTSFYNSMAVTLNSLVGGTGLATGRVYWIGDLTATTFKLYKNPSLEATTLVDITLDGSGTYSSYTFGEPIAKGITADTTRSYSYEFILDSTGRVWWINNIGGTPQNNLIYIGNDTLTGTTGRAISFIQGYLIVFRTSTIDYLQVSLLESSADLDSSPGWVYGWTSASSSDNTTVRPTLWGQDQVLYYGNSGRLGSIIVNAGSNFDPADSSTYTKNVTALDFQDGVVPTYLAELGIYLVVGSESNLVYLWDRISTSFNYPLILPENNTTRIVSTNSVAYIFAGNRGRIYVTNGTNINLWKKIPDYLTGVIEPYITWTDAQYWRNQIYFGFTASSNAGAALDNTGGIWAIDLASEALRMATQLSYAAYTGSAKVILPNLLSDTPGGAGLYMGWSNTGGTYGVDYGSTAPYTNYETYIDSEMIPVGTYLKPLTPSQVEWKTSYPLGGGGTAESIRIAYRTSLLSSFTTIGTTTATGTSVVGSTTGITTGSYAVSDYFRTNFQKAQWIQLRVSMSSNATTPTYNRLTEVRIRELT